MNNILCKLILKLFLTMLVMLSTLVAYANEETYYSQDRLSGLDAWVEDAELTWSHSDLGDWDDDGNIFDNQKISFEVKLNNAEQINAENRILGLGSKRTRLKNEMVRNDKYKHLYASRISQIEKTLYKSHLQQMSNI